MALVLVLNDLLFLVFARVVGKAIGFLKEMRIKNSSWTQKDASEFIFLCFLLCLLVSVRSLDRLSSLFSLSFLSLSGNTSEDNRGFDSSVQFISSHWKAIEIPYNLKKEFFGNTISSAIIICCCYQ